MEIGTEDDREVYITAPERVPTKLPIERPALPDPAKAPLTPEKAPAGS